ncbi:MAG: DUF4293 domain-containing protein [Prevotella sp.]|nr:DUF4293 domain-containing protein [Prevotella sp.]
MIQRIQTVYLLLAFIAAVVCLICPVGLFQADELGVGDITMYNLFLQQGDVKSFSVWSMFALLLFTCPLTILAIFLYKNRKLQARVCAYNILLCLAWIAVFVIFGYVNKPEGAKFTPFIWAALPAVALILHFLARKAIIHDEKLVRAADRIR